MGFFDFVKDAGKAISQQMDLAKVVLDLGIEIENPEVGLNDGVATVSGTVQSLADKEKIILALGNVAGVSRVEDNLEIEDYEDDETEAVFYTVQPGDTLGKIAKEHYGNAGKYPVIFEANTPMLSDPNKIYPGQVLRIPEL